MPDYFVSFKMKLTRIIRLRNLKKFLTKFENQCYIHQFHSVFSQYQYSSNNSLIENFSYFDRNILKFLMHIYRDDILKTIFYTLLQCVYFFNSSKNVRLISILYFLKNHVNCLLSIDTFLEFFVHITSFRLVTNTIFVLFLILK